MRRFLATLAPLLVVAACSAPQSPQNFSVVPVSFQSIPGWNTEQFQALTPILRQDCRRLSQLPPETSLGGSEVLASGRQAGEWAGPCAALETATDMRAYLEQWFQPYDVSASAFYTGYYEPQIEASALRGGPYQVPLYGRPDDLVRTRATNREMVTGRWVKGVFSPYFDRKAIDDGALAGRGLEIAWLKDPVDLFFLQIQGSGRLTLTDGRQMRVSYDGRNGQPYVPLGRVLVKEGDIAPGAVSMESIRAWLVAHPDRVREMLEQNPNYVFFRENTDISLAQGPIGAFGVPLTAGRSVAIDRAYVPFAAPVWVETTLPDAQGHVGNWDHLTFAQDIGTDIKGAGRADLFTGWGPLAQYVAGNLHSDGHMVILLPRASAETASNAP